MEIINHFFFSKSLILILRNEVKKLMKIDLAYIDNWSLRLDFIIFFMTIKTLLQRTGL